MLDLFETRRLAHELHWTDTQTPTAGRLLAVAAPCLQAAAIADNDGSPGPIASHLARHVDLEAVDREYDAAERDLAA
jgi:hypothetical protein